MNLIDYNQAVEALEKERQLLLNREQYGAENVLVHHALNVIAELPIIRQPEIIRCKDCAYALFQEGMQHGHVFCTKPFTERWQAVKPDDWFCADGKRET